MIAATIVDELGNPIQLTDEHGNPVKLTDEHGNPVHIAGVATTKQPPTLGDIISSDTVPGTGHLSSTARSEDAMKGGIRETGHHGEVAGDQWVHKKEEHDETSSASSSGSSEDDGQGGRRKKKKGLKQKIKEKLTGGKHKEEHGYTVDVHTTTTGPAGEQYQEQEKKSMIEKIKGKLPGHHSHH
uniref:Dehydrin 5 n=1 Tax=Populus alba x Populus glandulosa TaxID=153471 RepID=G0WPM6_9ROSI|nr:dehydrin 5 [Populus alba x Populus glandulosa]